MKFNETEIVWLISLLSQMQFKLAASNDYEIARSILVQLKSELEKVEQEK